MARAVRVSWNGSNRAIAEHKAAVAKTKSAIAKKKKSRDGYTNYLRTIHWQKKRIQALDFYGRKCAKCPSTIELEVHHLHYRSLFREKMEDLMVLCKDCHVKVHKEKAINAMLP